MLYMIRSVLSPIFSIALLMLGNGFFTTYISNRLDLDGYDESVIGYVHSAYFLGILIGAIRAEHIIRRIGHIRGFALFASINTATVLFMGWQVEPLTWIVMRLISGMSIAGLFVVIESWLLEKSTVDTRGRILSVYMISIYATQALGQFILDFVDPHSPDPFYAAGVLGAISIIPVAVTRHPSPDLHDPTLESFFTLIKGSPLGFSACVIGGALISSIYAFMPIFARTYMISVPMMISITILGGIILQWPFGRLSDIFDRRKILIGTGLLILAPSLLIPLFIDWHSAVFSLAFILGGLTFTIYPVGITLACERVESHNITAITGALLIAYGVGATAGPLLAPLFIDVFGISGLYAFLSASSLLLGAIGLTGLSYRSAVPEEERQEFVPLPGTSSAVAYDLDPRIEPEEYLESYGPETPPEEDVIP